MDIKIRQARKEDIKSLLQVYGNFIRQFVGSASRTPRRFSRMLRGKNNLTYVAVEGRNKIIGYIHARIDKRLNQGEFAEIVIEPEQDFESVAKALVEKVNIVFTEKKVAAIIAGSVRNPAYEKLFPMLGFSEYESMDVFMYSVLNVQKFLNELSPVFVANLKHMKKWNGTVQIECGGHSIFLEKAYENVQRIVWTSCPADLKVMLTSDLLSKLIFGTVDANEAYQAGQLKIEVLRKNEPTDQLLETLFPSKQFLIMDFW